MYSLKKQIDFPLGTIYLEISGIRYSLVTRKVNYVQHEVRFFFQVGNHPPVLDPFSHPKMPDKYRKAVAIFQTHVFSRPFSHASMQIYLFLFPTQIIPLNLTLNILACNDCKEVNSLTKERILIIGLGSVHAPAGTKEECKGYVQYQHEWCTQVRFCWNL